MWCQKYAIQIQASHIPGRDNVLADKLSRHLASPLEWALEQGVDDLVFQTWESPQMDRFTTVENTKLPNFCSLVHHPKARSMDGLGVRLNQNCYYTFLPAPILSQLLMKVVLEGATMILIAPKWPRREWYPTLLDLRIDVPIRLPLIPDLVTQDQGTLWHQYPADWHWWPGG